MKIIERSLQEIGQSLLVSLPKEWTKALNLKKGRKVKIMFTERGSLCIAPEFTRTEEKKEASIQFDRNFARRFFREYFDGNETITIWLAGGMDDAAKRQVYGLLKGFMNTQIVEETDKKMVVRCFRIEELSIEECAKRMFFLSLNMMDEVAQENSKVKILELEETMTRFYYMLVMQVRRYLSEGKYTDSAQIPLIRALDYRMVAEKMERIGDILKTLGNVTNKEQVKQLAAAKAYYSKAFACFFGSNYEEAIKLWSEAAVFKTAASRTPKDNLLRQQRERIESIAGYAREISMLVR